MNTNVTVKLLLDLFFFSIVSNVVSSLSLVWCVFSHSFVDDDGDRSLLFLFSSRVRLGIYVATDRALRQYSFLFSFDYEIVEEVECQYSGIQIHFLFDVDGILDEDEVRLRKLTTHFEYMQRRAHIITSYSQFFS